MGRPEKYPERNAEIRRLHAGGASCADIARHFSMPQTSVKMVVNSAIYALRAKARNDRLYGLDDEYTQKVRARNREYQRRKRSEAK